MRGSILRGVTQIEIYQLFSFSPIMYTNYHIQTSYTRPHHSYSYIGRVSTDKICNNKTNCRNISQRGDHEPYVFEFDKSLPDVC